MEGKNKKTKVFKWAAALMLAASVIGCKHNVSNTPETFTVTFSVESGNGTLKAKADGITETETSPITVEQGKTVTFTAEPNGGYEVDKWTITGGAFETGTGTGGSTTAKVKITATVNITVSFKALPPVQKYTVTLMQSEHGSVTAEPAIPSDNQIAKDTEITFTAQANAGYQINTWSITGDVLQSGGKSGNISAKVKITANTTVQVTFKLIEYASVPYAGLDTYLKDSALEANINYIKVTGLTAEALKGESVYPSSPEPSPLGKILKANETKKVALKFDGSIAGLTDMRACFSGCTSLTQAPDIPASVTNMSDCFHGCTSLTQAPDIPANVTGMYRCFSGCTSLTQAPQIPASVTDMYRCFSGCTSLTQAPQIPASVTDMYRCFSGCTSLTQAPDIPASVTYMSVCFYGCTSLTQAPQIPEHVTNMNACFGGCTSLTQAPDIPASVTDMSSCFSGCTNLTQAPDIPEHVTNMHACFSGCTSLTQAPDIPASVTNMSWCFSGCTKLISVTLKCNYNDDIDADGTHHFKNTFKNCSSLKQSTIKVPVGQFETYKANAGIMGTTADRFAKDE